MRLWPLLVVSVVGVPIVTIGFALLRVTAVPLLKMAYGIDCPTPPTASVAGTDEPFDGSRRPTLGAVATGLKVYALADAVLIVPFVLVLVFLGVAPGGDALSLAISATVSVVGVQWLRIQGRYDQREAGAYTALIVLGALLWFMTTNNVWDWPGMEFQSVVVQLVYAPGGAVATTGAVATLGGAALARTGRTSRARGWLLVVGGAVVSAVGFERKLSIARLPVDARPETNVLGLGPSELATVAYVGGLFAAGAALSVVLTVPSSSPAE